MKKEMCLTLTFLSFGIVANSSLLAEIPSDSTTSTTTATNPANSTSPTTNSSSVTMAKSSQDSEQKFKTTDAKDEQSQMAAWMIESAQAAKDYLDGLDREMYAESWAKGDQLFQHTITKEEWAKALSNSRRPLGKVTVRKLKNQRPAKDPKGLPKGAYMVIEYWTSFNKALESGELLTLRRGTDGKWRILTYQVN